MPRLLQCPTAASMLAFAARRSHSLQRLHSIISGSVVFFAAISYLVFLAKLNQDGVLLTKLDASWSSVNHVQHRLLREVFYWKYETASLKESHSLDKSIWNRLIFCLKLILSGVVTSMNSTINCMVYERVTSSWSDCACHCKLSLLGDLQQNEMSWITLPTSVNVDLIREWSNCGCSGSLLQAEEGEGGHQTHQLGKVSNQHGWAPGKKRSKYLKKVLLLWCRCFTSLSVDLATVCVLQRKCLSQNKFW